MDKNNLHDSPEEMEHEIHALERLAKLKESGVIDEKEFKEEKDKILHHAFNEETDPHSIKPQRGKVSKPAPFWKKRKTFLWGSLGLVVIIIGLLFYNKQSKASNLREIVEATGNGDVSKISKLLSDDSTLVHTRENLVAIAASTNKRELVEILLKYHANPNGYDDKGYTALAYAAQNGDSALTRLLIKAGASVELGKKLSTDTVSYTPLMLTAQHGRPETAQILLSSGAEVNKKNETGKTAMDYGVEAGGPKVITVLLRNGAETKIPENMTIKLRGRIANLPVTFTMYVNGFGNRVASEVVSGYAHYMYVSDNDYEYTIDMNSRTAVRHLNDNEHSRLKGIDLDNLINNYSSYNLLDVSLDTTLFAGKPCQILELKDYGGDIVKLWTWSGIPLKMIAWTNSSEWMNVKVQNIDEKAIISESRFKVPSNVAITN